MPAHRSGWKDVRYKSAVSYFLGVFFLISTSLRGAHPWAFLPGSSSVPTLLFCCQGAVQRLTGCTAVLAGERCRHAWTTGHTDREQLWHEWIVMRSPFPPLIPDNLHFECPSSWPYWGGLPGLCVAPLKISPFWGELVFFAI